jgi:ferrous iron transport protein B
LATPLREPARVGARRTVTAVLAGRPNSGKTSLMMHLTRTAQRPVNFPGTSVERNESRIDVGDATLCAIDVPGIASLAPITRDEAVTIDLLRGNDGTAPDVICAVLDASKLSVELHLLRELQSLGRPIVVALNKLDVTRRLGRPVDPAALQRELGLPVFATNAHGGQGVDALRQGLVDHVGTPEPARPFDPDELARRLQPITSTRGGITEALDAVLLHRFLGLPILALVVFAVFQLVFSGAEPFMTWIEAGQDFVGDTLAARIPPGALQSFVVDGIVNGVGSILVFVPQVALLIALVTILEATGYMARAAFLLDRVLHRVGLSGRSFVPLASSFACAIPGILASRIIDNERDRIATIVVSPLMSCSARLPVYVVLIGAFFPVAWSGVVLFGLYALGIVTAAAVAFVLRRTVLRGGSSILLMELPVYHRPSWRVVGHQVWSACREFFVMAGTVIFATAIVIWVLSYYPRPSAVHAEFEAQRAVIAADTDSGRRELERLDRAERTAYFEQSLLARAGKAIQPVFAPAGFDWRTTVGILSAFPARELIVPTMGILYSLGDVDPGHYDVASLRSGDGPDDGLRHKLRTATDPDGERSFTALTALALMVFFALCSQCMATLGAIRRETRSWRWPWFTFAYMTVLAWLAAVAVFQVGTLLGYGGNA